MVGPADRESFFAAQRRYRRQTWRLVVFCYLAAVLGCIPASIVLSPMLFAVLLLLGRLAELAGWLSPDFVSGLIHRVADALADTVAYGLHAVFGGEPVAAPSWNVLAVVIIAMLVPGMVAMLTLWLLVYGAFARAGVGGVLLAMGAREVNPRDPKDRQLANVVTEMAIAANIPQPRVAILDDGDARWRYAARMRIARDLLAGGAKPSAVARRVGYAHLPSFSTAFTRLHGLSPREFQERESD